MNKQNIKKIHFIGINGSGISGVACIAKKRGFSVTGCDLNETGDYTEQLKRNGILPQVGHNKEHLKGQDLIVASPAIFYAERYKKIEEQNIAMKNKNLIKWQQFLGDYIMDGRNVVAICGTHGKTTTTSAVGLLLEKASFDPTVFVGGKVIDWNSTFRVGGSDWYVCEADEYDRNFISYHPKFLLFNNLEMEHPELFKSFTEYKNVFTEFLKTVQMGGKIIFNADDKNILSLLKKLNKLFLSKGIKLHGYSLQNLPKISGLNCTLSSVKTLKQGFEIDKKYKFQMTIPGAHNIRNLAMVSLLGLELGISYNDCYFVIKEFKGSKRRIENLYSGKKFVVFDDYAHHQTQVKTTLEAVRGILKKKDFLIAILEPHMISRFKLNHKEYTNSLKIADHAILTQVYRGREYDKKDLDLNNYIRGEKSIEFIASQDGILKRIKEISKKRKNGKIYVVVMGAGYSYKIANVLAKELES